MNKSHNTDFSLLIKPVSYRCNLNCRYCFYLEKEQFFGSAATISQHVLEQLVSDFMSTSQANYAFAWQGGEPTLAG
ncbi:MAG: 4Fe-4S cluster-binding domain-containing protein, partial [Victivallaceae bacterium]|nr:4Fe-4S cluster-binding domain-containing protein [Victivallaceae bacterium]